MSIRVGRIALLHSRAIVANNTVEVVFNPEEGPPLGALPRVVRLRAFDTDEVRPGRALVVGSSWGEGRSILHFSKPLNQAIPTAAPRDMVITDCQDEWP